MNEWMSECHLKSSNFTVLSSGVVMDADLMLKEKWNAGPVMSSWYGGTSNLVYCLQQEKS